MWLALASLVGATGCEVAEPSGSASVALSEAPVLVSHRRVSEPAPGSDGRPLYALAWRDSTGELTPIDLPRPALHAVALDEQVFWVDGDHALHRYASGADEWIADGVFARPIAREECIFFVQGGAGEPQTVRWIAVDGTEGRLATRLYQLGALTLAPDESALLGVGSTNGGVAGLWVLPFRGDARCLTNCELRVGGDWGDAFVPAPAAADGLTFEGDEVRWDTPAGPVTRTWRQP